MRGKQVVLALIAAAVLVLWWWSGNGEPQPTPDTGEASQVQTHEPGAGSTDPDSGLPWIRVDDLPDEALETIDLIEQDGPYPHPCCDDTTFRNDEGLLPDHPRGYYREYTVETPGLDHRGALRIVTGDGGEFYWTEDHYESFARIRFESSGGGS